MAVEQVGTFLLGHAVATLGFCLGTIAVRGRTPPRWMVPWYLICKEDPDNPQPLDPEALTLTRLSIAGGGATAFLIGILLVYSAFH